MPYSRAALVLACLIAAIGLGELIYFGAGYLPRQWGPIMLWAVLPAPLAYWLARRLVCSKVGARIVVAALGLALALGAWGAWDVTLGPSRNEGLNGLVVVGVPAYQNAMLAVALILAFFVERRFRSASA